jgi:hypothetical protein
MSHAHSHHDTDLRARPLRVLSDVPTALESLKGPTLAERAGDVIGTIVAPIFAAVSRARHARAFHPDGVTCSGYAEALDRPEFRGLGARLSGHVLVRFSGAVKRRSREEGRDALGLAIRFRRSAKVEVEPDIDDQDILFATLRSLFTAPVAKLVTDQHDYLANAYWAAAPFEVFGVGRVMLRVSPMGVPHAGGHTRDERLLRGIEAGRVRLCLEARRPFTTIYSPIAILHIDAPADVDQEALAFSPFRTGRGFVPRGFIHALRRAVYPASQRARAARP